MSPPLNTQSRFVSPKHCEVHWPAVQTALDLAVRQVEQSVGVTRRSSRPTMTSDADRRRPPDVPPLKLTGPGPAVATPPLVGYDVEADEDVARPALRSAKRRTQINKVKIKMGSCEAAE